MCWSSSYLKLYSLVGRANNTKLGLEKTMLAVAYVLQKVQNHKKMHMQRVHPNLPVRPI
jgi:hypothetical protein